MIGLRGEGGMIRICYVLGVEIVHGGGEGGKGERIEWVMIFTWRPR